MFIQEQATKAKKKGRGRALLCLGFALTALPPRKRPGIHCTEDWVSPRAGLDGCGESRPHHHSTLDHPARNESLYRYAM
jgi:hypothetical protein